MGQRLNIEIWNKGKVLANSYYHWSAYSKEASKLISTILDYIRNIPVSEDTTDYAIKCLETTGAGMNEDEKERFRLLDYSDDKINTYQDCVSRNEGIISITNEGIEETRVWYEHYVNIYLDEKRIEYNVCYRQEPLEWEKDQREFYDNENANFRNLYKSNYNLNDIKFDEFGSFITFMNDICDNHDGYYYDLIHRQVIEFVE